MIFRVAKGDSQLTSSSSRIFGASCLVSAQCAPNRYCWPVWLIGTKSLKNGNLDFGSHLNHSILFHGYFEESPDFGWKRRTDWFSPLSKPQLRVILECDSICSDDTVVAARKS